MTTLTHGEKIKLKTMAMKRLAHRKPRETLNHIMRMAPVTAMGLLIDSKLEVDYTDASQVVKWIIKACQTKENPKNCVAELADECMVGNIAYDDYLDRLCLAKKRMKRKKLEFRRLSKNI
jgi:hypothetical protein